MPFSSSKSTQVKIEHVLGCVIIVLVKNKEVDYVIVNHGIFHQYGVRYGIWNTSRGISLDIPLCSVNGHLPDDMMI